MCQCSVFNVNIKNVIMSQYLWQYYMHTLEPFASANSTEYSFNLYTLEIINLKARREPKKLP